MKLMYDIDESLYYIEFGESSSRLAFKTEIDARRFMKVTQDDEELVRVNGIKFKRLSEVA